MRFAVGLVLVAGCDQASGLTKVCLDDNGFDRALTPAEILGLETP